MSVLHCDYFHLFLDFICKLPKLNTVDKNDIILATEQLNAQILVL
jgi:hypothetical protein